MSDTAARPTSPPFVLGRVVATPGALDALRPHPGFLNQIVARHASGDWGEVNRHDRKANDAALADGSRVFSAYTTPTGKKVWVITEADRACTCILLPSDY
jgi:hypothetical protein